MNKTNVIVSKRLNDAINFYNRCGSDKLTLDSVGEGPKYILRLNGELVIDSVYESVIYGEVVNCEISTNEKPVYDNIWSDKNA